MENITMLNLKELEEFKKLETKIQELSTKLIDEINIISPIKGYEFLNLESFDSSSIYFSGDEYWSYGGHEEYKYSIPMKFIFDEKLKNDFIEKLEWEVKEKKLKEIENNEKIKDDELEKKRKKYEELKSEFEK
jgi:hypothetical protein